MRRGHSAVSALSEAHVVTRVGKKRGSTWADTFIDYASGKRMGSLRICLGSLWRCLTRLEYVDNSELAAEGARCGRRCMRLVLGTNGLTSADSYFTSLIRDEVANRPVRIQLKPQRCCRRATPAVFSSTPGRAAEASVGAGPN